MGRSPTAQRSGPRDAATKVAQHRLSVLELARELGNVAEACRQRGLDRTSFYEWKRRFQTQGFDGLKDLPPIHKSHPQTTSPEVVEKIKALALAHPAYGCNRHEAMLALEGSVLVSVGNVKEPSRLSGSQALMFTRATSAPAVSTWRPSARDLVNRLTRRNVSSFSSSGKPDVPNTMPG